MLRETEQNPFEAEEDNEDEPEPPTHLHSRQASVAQSSRSATPPPSFFSSSSSPTATKKSKKDKKSSKKKPKAFNLEAEKDAMKSCIADSSVASTNLLNALKLINREKERISENQNAAQSFDNCKLLRRKILRYVS